MLAAFAYLQSDLDHYLSVIYRPICSSSRL